MDKFTASPDEPPVYEDPDESTPEPVVSQRPSIPVPPQKPATGLAYIPPTIRPVPPPQATVEEEEYCIPDDDAPPPVVPVRRGAQRQAASTPAPPTRPGVPPIPTAAGQQDTDSQHKSKMLWMKEHGLTDRTSRE